VAHQPARLGLPDPAGVELFLDVDEAAFAQTQAASQLPT
jgi:hypothetical protein